jgi:hypothetical protein
MTEARTHADRANTLLEDIKPELLKLLGGAPPHGSIGIDLILHDGEVTRIVSKMEISRIPRKGGGTHGGL